MDGTEMFDKITNDGVPRKTLNMVIARKNVGKSIMLIDDEIKKYLDVLNEMLDERDELDYMIVEQYNLVVKLAEQRYEEMRKKYG